MARLRRRKARDAKPFAVMVANLASAARLAEIGPIERALLEGRSRPIVLVRSRGVVAPSVAPRLRDVGLMLAYTPLHWLVLHALAGSPEFRSWRDAPSDLALVATSANRGRGAAGRLRRRRIAPADRNRRPDRDARPRDRRQSRRFRRARARRRARLSAARARFCSRSDRPRRRRAERHRRGRRPQEHDHASRAAARPSSRSTSAISTTARPSASATRPSGI